MVAPVNSEKTFAEKEADRARTWSAERVAASQDVYEQFGKIIDRGPLDWNRRHRGEENFIEFCNTYAKEAFFLKWSSNHYRAAECIEDAVRSGSTFAFAMPRGSGKTTLARWAVVWAILTGLSPYSVLIASSQATAQKLLKNLKTTLRFNELLAEDFPEAILPVRHIKGEARKATGQKFKGEPTLIEWTKTAIVLAAIPVEYSKCNSSVIDVTGIEGEIRGRQYERPDGKIIRPTFTLLDDPQTRESAKSTKQSSDRVDILAGDIAYMAGPTTPMGVVMPCTIIKQGDMAAQMLDKKLHPEWHGEITKLMDSFPTNEKKWEEYRNIQEESFVNGGNGEEATEFYRRHQSVMDEGASVSWPERFKDTEVSAIQHAMNLKFKDEDAFFAEYQNEPRTGQDDEINLISAEALALRILPNCKRGVVPAYATRLTGFIDLSKKVLWWGVCAWDDDFTGTIVDYGIWPEQKTRYNTLASCKVTMQMKRLGTSKEVYIQTGLEKLTDYLIMERVWKSEAKVMFDVESLLIDEGWEQQIVHAFYRRCKHKGIITPSKGRGIKVSGKPLNDPNTRPKPGEKRGNHWKEAPTKTGIRSIQFDTNYWKSFFHQRLECDVKDKSAFTLFDQKRHYHRMFSEQVTAEYYNELKHEGTGNTKQEWSQYPDKPDNHFLDVCVGNCVAASRLGAKLPILESGPKAQAKKQLKPSERQALKRKRKR